jgi:DNA polymerase elongation subunit (family B)
MQVGNITLKCHAYEKTLDAVQRLLATRLLPSAGWIRGKGIKLTKSEKESTRTHEYVVSFKDLHPLSEEESLKMPIVHPTIFSFDNEANSSRITCMPKSNLPGDKVFQIGFTILKPALNNEPKTYEKYLYCLGNPDPIENVTIKIFLSEADLMVGLTEKIREVDPEVILGFNILGWDIKYMIERCIKYGNCLSEFDLIGCLLGRHAPKETIAWSSSAHRKQNFEYLKADGRLFIDMLPYVKKKFKLHNYKLETVCEELLKTANKDPVKPKDIFRAYRNWHKYSLNPQDETLRKISAETLSVVGKYCVMDSYVTLLLYEKLQAWFDLVESATTNCVTIFDMITKGQQQKMYSQVYTHCLHNEIVPESNAYKTGANEHCSGAYVGEPKKGLYNNVIPLDFCALYPSIMMSYNIDYTKLVIDDSIPDEDCHVMIWSEHESCKCPKDTTPNKKPKKDKNGKSIIKCSEYKYRWLKHESVSDKGVIPSLLEKLLNARKKTKKLIVYNKTEIKIIEKILTKETIDDELKQQFEEVIKYYENKGEIPISITLIQEHNNEINEKEIKILKERIEILKVLNLILDLRQVAYKVNANSMYGACGVKEGRLPFLPGAMSVTYIGRISILKVNDFIENKKNGVVIYNDTDSSYCFFPDFEGKPVIDLWNFALSIVQDIKSLFPSKMSLEFEEKIYRKFLILSKKRYMALSMDKDGKISDDMMQRGVVLQRRDNCKALRDVYKSLILKIFENHDELVKIKEIQNIKERYNHPIVKDLLNMIIFAVDDMFKWKHTYKDFIITKQLARDIKEYKRPKSLPHVALAIKMEARGVNIASGDRIEYLVCKHKTFEKKDTQKDKIEDLAYFLEFREILRVSYIDYLKQFINPLDQICSVVMCVDKFVKQHWEQRIKYSKVVERIQYHGRPKMIFTT